MDQETYQSLVKVIDYLWTDEHRHWNESGNTDDHIFRDVLRLHEWSVEVAKNYDVNVNVAGKPNALEKLFNSLPEKDKRRE